MQAITKLKPCTKISFCVATMLPLIQNKLLAKFENFMKTDGYNGSKNNTDVKYS